MIAAVEDLAGRGHWDAIYRQASPVGHRWRPVDYAARTLERALTEAIDRYRPRSVLEIGCGNSPWLSYLARTRGLAVAGMDYSEIGCDLVRRALAASGLERPVHCVDFRSAEADRVGQYDLVFSMGLAEHFSDLEEVLACLLRFVRPGGVLWTEVPNLRSVHGLLSWLWNPAVLARHRLLDREELLRAYRRLGLTEVHGDYCGLFSFNVVPWEVGPLVPALLPAITKLNRWMDGRIVRMGRFRGIRPLAPFIYAVGRRPE